MSKFTKGKAYWTTNHHFTKCAESPGKAVLCHDDDTSFALWCSPEDYEKYKCRFDNWRDWHHQAKSAFHIRDGEIIGEVSCS